MFQSLYPKQLSTLSFPLLIKCGKLEILLDSSCSCCTPLSSFSPIMDNSSSTERKTFITLVPDHVTRALACNGRVCDLIKVLLSLLNIISFCWSTCISWQDPPPVEANFCQLLLKILQQDLWVYLFFWCIMNSSTILVVIVLLTGSWLSVQIRKSTPCSLGWVNLLYLLKR